jgi:exopolysaccharide production protein ExoQ
MTGSTTALLAVLIAIAGMAGLAFLRRGPIWTVVGLWLFVVVCMVAAAILLLAPDLFFSAVGKEPTLTGRTGLWEALERQIAKQPLTGYGYGAFWQGKAGPAEIVRKEIQWAAHNADNAWMELKVQLGLVGMWLMIATLAAYVAAALTRLWKGPEAYWAILFVILVGIFSISESMLARPNDTTWVIFVATFAKMLQWRGSDTAY